MSVLLCPCCGYETVEPDVEWVDSWEIVEELCSECERVYYEDELAVP